VDQETVHAAVARAFADTGAGTRAWPDPHPDGEPAEDEYSRCLDPAKYAVVGARVEAWLRALGELGLATVSEVEDPGPAWRDGPPHGAAEVTGARWVRPSRPGAVPLLVSLRDLEGVPDGFLVLGAGEPAVEIARVPFCGCDACDDGSDELIRGLDEHLLDALSGELVHISIRGGYVLAGRNGWSANVSAGGADIERLLAEARQGRSRHPVVLGACWW
jgi:hypothetical protein